LLAALPVMLLSACGWTVSGLAAAPQRRLIVVMLDETGSFVNYWQDCVGFAALVANRLKPGDAFAVIGIDDHGNDPEDARIPVTMINQGSLMALADKKTLAKKVKLLEPRKAKKPLTDILHAIQQASIFANSPALQGYKPMVLFFSDMQETPRLPSPADIKGWGFETRGEAYCFYVNVTDWVDRSKKQKGTSWDSLVGSWTAILNAAGLDADPKKSFYQRGDTQVGISRLFPAGF
jgi:hypothetical protein